MKTMGWYSLMAAAGFITGCASHSPRYDSEAPGDNIVGTRMNASFSSDSAGVEDQNNSPAPEGAMPIQLTIDQLPPAAQATIRREAGERRIVKIKREDQDGQAVYRVELTRDGDLFHGLLVVTPNGTLLRESHLAEPNGPGPNH
jgi:hypothetical protein